VRRVRDVLVLGVGLAAACGPHGKPVSTPARPEATVPFALVPVPAGVQTVAGTGLEIGPNTVVTAPSDPAVQRIAAGLALLFKQGTGIAVPVRSGPTAVSIALSLDPGATYGEEGYELATAGPNATLKARTPAGLFYGVQTIRQLLPYWSEYRAVVFLQPKPLTLRAVHITDSPRYPWRGAMLDVARHFFGVEDVKRFIDLLALHKMNRLHLHLADDQGWRIEIKKRPDLTLKGGSTQVGGGPGGFYTQAQFADIVSYAGEHFITIVPEVDMPGHTNAALASYPELNCSGQSPQLFTGIDVGFSALCIDKDATYRFIDDIVGEIAAMTPGDYFHMGGDEVKTLTPAQYTAFVERVQTIVQAHGKRMIGWDEIAAANLLPSSIVQHWRPDAARAELARAPHLILSPANRVYLDMKYDAQTMLGLNWAALIPVQAAYDWNPATLLPEAPASAILGVEAPLWSETTATIRDVEFLAMPRLAAAAELAWSPSAQHDWASFRSRLGAQAPRWTALGVNFYRAPEIPWRAVGNAE